MKKSRILAGFGVFLIVASVAPARAEEQNTSRMPDERKVTRLLNLEKGEDGQVPITKFGGVPWWPQGTSRPACSRGHAMSFVGQVLLSDVPELGPRDRTLLSFHYCMDCSWTGHMSFGYGDYVLNPPGHRGYQVDVFENIDSVQADQKGEVTLLDPPQMEEGTPFPPRRVRFQNVLEVPGTFGDEDPEGVDTRAYSDAYPVMASSDEIENQMASKIGGWPTWEQFPTWLECPEGRRMVFVGQIDYADYRQGPWGGGGYGYLFVCPKSCKSRKGELLIQTS